MHLRSLTTLASAVVAGALLLLLGGCGTLRTAKVPMDTEWHRTDCAARPDTLLVFLPGRYSETSEFVREGFVDEVRQRRIAADIVIADAHMGYYDNRTLVDRLQADVLVPARTAGYRSIWLVGISVGGLGSLLNEEMVPGGVAGILLLAPYLGERALSQQIERSGGLQAWKAPTGALPLEQMETRLWRWLQANAASGTPPLYLGFGTEDRFADSQRVLAAALPPNRVFTASGGHDWPVWRHLWQQALGALPLPTCR